MDPRAFIHRLEHAPEDLPWRLISATIKGRWQAADVDWLVAVAQEIPRMASPNVLSGVIQAIALTPGIASVEAIASLGSQVWRDIRHGHQQDAMARRIASQLSHAQPTAVLARAYGLPTFEHRDDLLACWTQEAVLRGADVRHPAIVKGWTELAERGHPLACLPLIAP